MRATTLVFGLVAYGACVLASIAPAAANIVVAVDKSSQRMVVYVEGTARYNWKVSTGGPGYDTPAGSFHPFRMEKDHFSKEWDDAPMPYSVFFTSQGHAIHGSTHINRLGTPASHGCIRIAPANAAILFGLIKAEGLDHTQVIVMGDLAGIGYRAPRKMRPPPPPPEWQYDQPPMMYPDEPVPPPWAFQAPGMYEEDPSGYTYEKGW